MTSDRGTDQVMDERRELLAGFIRSEVFGEFELGSELLPLLDSVSLVKLLMFIESEFHVTLDVSALGFDNFRDLDALLQTIDAT